MFSVENNSIPKKEISPYINLRHRKRLENLVHFYSNETNIQLFFMIINEDTCLSLRDIDWFVTNYSDMHNIEYNLPSIYKVNDMYTHDFKIPFKVHQSYKSNLKSYSKKLFDPFRRRQRIYYLPPQKNNQFICQFLTEKEIDKIDNLKNLDMVETTAGQLNFFEWAISNGVIAYIIKHLQEIKHDMTNIYHKRSGTKEKIKKGSKLSKASTSVVRRNINVIVSLQ